MNGSVTRLYNERDSLNLIHALDNENSPELWEANIVKASLDTIWDSLRKVQERFFLEEELKELIGSSTFNEGKNVLVIDCGPGKNNCELSPFFPKKQFHAQTFTVDYFKSIRDRRFISKLNTIGTNFLKEEGSKYDYIILKFVLQHMSDPRPFFELLAEKLSLQAEVLVIESADKLFYFTPAIPEMEKLFGKFGFLQSGKGGNRKNFDLKKYGAKEVVSSENRPVSFFHQRKKRHFVSAIMLMAAILEKHLGGKTNYQGLGDDLLNWYNNPQASGQLALNTIRLKF